MVQRLGQRILRAVGGSASERAVVARAVEPILEDGTARLDAGLAALGRGDLATGAAVERALRAEHPSVPGRPGAWVVHGETGLDDSPREGSLLGAAWRGACRYPGTKRRAQDVQRAVLREGRGARADACIEGALREAEPALPAGALGTGIVTAIHTRTFDVGDHASVMEIVCQPFAVAGRERRRPCACLCRAVVVARFATGGDREKEWAQESHEVPYPAVFGSAPPSFVAASSRTLLESPDKGVREVSMERTRPVLVVDDETDIRALLVRQLEREGLPARGAATGMEALEMAAADPPSLVILDLMLPGMPGTEVCRRLRAEPETRSVPIIMLSARSDEIDRVVGFEVGADDYVTKPFSVRELVLRVRAVLRRAITVSEPAEPSPETRADMEAALLRIDEDAHRVYVHGEEVTLTATEFRLLSTLARRAGRVQTRGTLLRDVWELPPDLNTRTVDTHMKRLREKLGAAHVHIETVRGVGYRFQRDVDAERATEREDSEA